MWATAYARNLKFTKRSHMADSASVIAFPLYHGTSSLFLSDFKPGTTPQLWPHKESALNFLKKAWNRLSEIRDRATGKIEWDTPLEVMSLYIGNTIEQASGASNWQHGDLYLAANKQAAVTYARGGARHGGELLTMCREVIDALSKVDCHYADQLIRSTESLDKFLRGTDLPPILVEFTGIRVCDLSTESGEPVLPRHLTNLADNWLSESCGADGLVQQIASERMNFRLENGSGAVERVFEVHDPEVVGSRCTFVLKEIRNSLAWV